MMINYLEINKLSQLLMPLSEGVMPATLVLAVIVIAMVNIILVIIKAGADTKSLDLKRAIIINNTIIAVITFLEILKIIAWYL